MQKPAPIAFPIHPHLQNRWSPRAFDTRPVEREKVLSLLEATRWSPSSNNQQPWRFILALRENEVEFQRMLGVLSNNNQRWAKDVPLFIMIIANTQLPDGNPNRYYGHDTGIALANLTLQAIDMGLMLHPMAGFNPELARQAYNIPHEYEPMTINAIGYYGSIDQLPEDIQVRENKPRQRYPLDQLVFEGVFGNVSPLVK